MEIIKPNILIFLLIEAFIATIVEKKAIIEKVILDSQ